MVTWKNSYKIRYLAICIALGFLLNGCAAAPRKITQYPETQLKVLCARHNVQWQWDGVSQVIILKRNNYKARTLIGSNIAVIGNQRVSLSGPIIRKNNIIFVPPDFKRKVIDQLKYEKIRKIAKFKKIVIDAGHGGKDPGATGRSGLKEKVVNLDVSKRLKKILEKKGYDVVMTRNSDKFISLEKRTEIASRAKADLFVSIHANANKWRGLNGLEVYTLREPGKEKLSIEQREMNKEILFKKLAMKRNIPALKKIVSSMLEKHKKEESEALASFVANEISKSVGMKNRGKIRSQFFVLRNNLIPSILIEMGYLSNPKEEKLFKTSSYRQKLAEAIAKSIQDYAN